MKTFTKIVHTVFLKPTYEGGTTYFLARVWTEGIDHYAWKIAYEGGSGHPAFVGSEVHPDIIEECEREYQLNLLYDKWIVMMESDMKKRHATKAMQDLAEGALKTREEFIQTCLTNEKFFIFVSSIPYEALGHAPILRVVKDNK